MSPKYYKEYSRFLVSADCIVFGFSEGGLSLLLLKRNMEPAKGQWSLPGGFLMDHESAEEAAYRVLYSLTGLEQLYLEQLGLFSEEDRDPGERVLSVAYYALINVAEYDKSVIKQHNACWKRLDDLPDLIFDHESMVETALKRLRQKASTRPIGFNLLPEKFTLPQLQALYEGIYGYPIDKRNFRKKIHVMEFLEKLNEKDRKSSKRGAFLYKFNKEKYEVALEKGGAFTL
jgi:8-oxo-dGTP diphosphatase